MTAAGGIIHSEMPIMKEGRLHGFQLWVNMPAKLKMSKPSYQNIEPQEIPEFKDQEK
jgi:redox-sensitive bicupin YhaK (pirin superfamily)